MSETGGVSRDLSERVKLTGEDSEGGLVSGVSESDLDAGSKAEGVNVALRDVEGDGHGEEGALSLAVDLGESEGVTDAVAISAKPVARACAMAYLRGVVGLVHEALERRETSVHDELEVTELSLSSGHIAHASTAALTSVRKMSLSCRASSTSESC